MTASKPPQDASSPVTANPWGALRQFTSARIALGRAGTSLPTQPHLAFQLAHAQARSAVHREADFATLESALQALAPPVYRLRSAAPTRPLYLQRPDLGRQLDGACAARLDTAPPGERASDVVFVVADGLSSLAIERNAVPFLQTLLPALAQGGWSVGPLALVQNARVAIGDDIAARLGAAMVVVLIGERPGLSSPDSMGIYMTWQPRMGLTDESRNCISNVRAQGLSHAAAAHKLHYLMDQARQRRLSGVNLKDESDAQAPRLAAQAPAGRHFLLGAKDAPP
jgi:ethanolamine ammonia-lyase small subunit